MTARRTLKVTPISVSVHRPGDSPVFGESVTLIRVDDDAAGPFIVISQPGGKESRSDLAPGEVAFDLDELLAVTAAAKRLIAAQPEEPK